ncbi:hypothetical protein JM946_02235 [Steroidobacter sp. S1-65]|uniref:SHOCT domain-containing protein n=1 Tax=Steroidobacter gossypii TaxID=2805490 RepID=A0ABS1WRE1_9GAMM|nr:hypothetical protein [Steroidobacter gossypii]MBM0103539.1 hypothetical protein [Steroidobacter gossypii]
MNAVADTTMQEPQGRPVRARAEHISIEAGHDDVLPNAKKRPHRKARLNYALTSKLRGCDTQLALLDDHFLSVHLTRPDSEPKKYDFDLRFANAKPMIVRHIAWFWLALAISLAGLATCALWMLWPQTAAEWLSPVLITALAALLAAAGSVLMFLRRTTESLEFTSVHGGVTLVSVTGAIGSAREGKKFFVELIKSINAAKAARPQPPQQFLRDEMREHHRLRELGVLSEAQYETSKSRILAAH